MRVLSVIDTLDASGGAERSLASLAPELSSLGVEVHVAYLRERPHTIAGELRAAGAKVYSLAGRGGRFANAMRIAQLAHALRPDLIHTTLFEADQAGRVGARVAGRPVVSSLVNIAYGRDQATTPQLSAWKLRAAQTTDALTARLPVRFHAITSYVAGVMAARLRIPRTRIDIVPRGRDPARLGRRTEDRRARIRAELDVGEHESLVVAIGRQEWQKGHDTLVAATPELIRRRPDTVVLIAGRAGRQTERLQQTIARDNLDRRVRILGFRDDAPELLCAADVFAYPSRWEGFGSTLLEAMALQAPIVASDVPAVREVLTPAEARLVPPSDPSALAGAIADCLDDRNAARCRADAARRRFFERYTIERSARGMVRFYERALSAGRKS